MQIDMFGGQGEDGNGGSPPMLGANGWRMPETEAFVLALQRRSLPMVLTMLNRMSVNTAWKVLLEAGFAVGTNGNRVALMASVERDLITATQQGITGHDVRKMQQASTRMENDVAPVAVDKGGMHGEGSDTRDNGGVEQQGADRLDKLLEVFAPVGNQVVTAALMDIGSAVEALRKAHSSVDVIGVLERASMRLMQSGHAPQAEVVDEVVESLGSPRVAEHEVEAPPLVAIPERQLDSRGNPIYRVGERVEFGEGSRGQGRHGAIAEVRPITMRTITSGAGPGTSETTYYYDVKTDAGAVIHTSADEIMVESARREFVPDPVVDGKAIEPDALQRSLSNARQNIDKQLAAAQRARKAENIATHKQQAQAAREKADRYQAVWDQWAREYPVEAAKYAPTKTASHAVPTVEVDGVLQAAGLVVSKGTTNNGKPVWEVTGNTREHAETLKRMGGRWYGPKRAWSFYNDDPSAMLAGKLGTAVAPAAPVVAIPSAIQVERNEVHLPDSAYIYRKSTNGVWDWRVANAPRTVSNALKADSPIIARLEAMLAEKNEQKGELEMAVVADARTMVVGAESGPIANGVANENSSMHNAGKEGDHNGTSVYAGTVRADASAASGEHGRNGGVDQQPVGAGMAGPRADDGGERNVSSAAAGTDGTRENRVVGSGDGNGAPVEQRDIGDARGTGGTADGRGLAAVLQTSVDIPALESELQSRREYARGDNFNTISLALDRLSRGDVKWAVELATKVGIVVKPVVPEHGFARFRSDIPDETWLAEKRQDSVASGVNDFGVPKYMGPITGSFSRVLHLSIERLAAVPGERGEQGMNRRAETLEYLRANWDTVSKDGIYVEVAPDGQAWMREGNHRVMVAVEKGVESLPVEVRYFSGGERYSKTFAPDVLIDEDRRLFRGQHPAAIPEKTAGGRTVADDYVLSAEDRVGLGGLGEKFSDNFRAIQVVKRLAAENRHAVPDEQRQLARYVGWGGLKGVFDPDNKQWAKQREELKALLSEQEWAAAKRSVLDAFYTSPTVVNAMYAGVKRMGFTGGRWLDPSVGVGNFIGFMPAEMREASTVHGVELDMLTSEIVSALYPTAKIAKATGFEAYKVPAGYFDMVMGNPPFGSQAVVDEVGSVYSGWSIHNYFFAKSIEMLRPGGIMPMVVSHNFLDKLDPHVRQWIARRAELVSGVRLPNTAFKENANTEVVTDVLIFRRLDDMTIGKQVAPAWLETTDVPLVNSKTGETEMLPVNNYFLANPQNVLGTQSAMGTMYRANEYTVEPNGDLGEQLAAWVETLPEGIYVPFEHTAEAATHLADVEIPDGIKEGSFFLLNEGKIGLRLPDLLGKTRAVEWTPPNKTALERMQGMIWLRTVLRRQMALERSPGSDDAQIERGRATLNQAYDDFQKKCGFLNDPVNRRLFMDDTESALVQALEFDYEKAVTPAKAEEYGIEARPARARKADIFRQRVLFPPMEMAHVETAKDALLHSLNQFGRVNLDYMQEAYGKDQDTLLLELDELIYRDPVRGLVTADEYLSGDVKTKLAEARRAAEGNPALSKNVAALEAVIPADKLPSEIFVSIGAIWVPRDIYAAFAKEISGATISYQHLKASGQWLAGERVGGDYAKNNNEFGTEKMGALDILIQTMNGRGLEVKKLVDEGGTKKYVTDEEATEAVRQRGDKIRALWDSWIWADGDRADQLAQIYNDHFNRTVERKFDGTHLTFPGMSPAIALLQHQKNGVWRGVQDRVMLADQVVGAGKTFEMATIAMEMRRLGIARKPMFAVPNHLTLQWRSDFYRLYPGANVLAATPQDFEKENREKLFSKIVTGNWDAVIIGHSSLKKIGVPVEAEMKIFEDQLEEIAEAVESMKRERGDRNIIRDMEKIKTNLEAKLKTLKDKAGKKDQVVNFEDLGVDAMFIDEMHEFKNLFFYTQMQRVAGLGNPAGSGKAFDLFVKIRWLKETFGEEAPLITGTGTPVSNSLAEMFTMQRYMQYDKLQAQGLHNFDSWAKQFGDVQTVYEVAPSGTGYRLSQRFAKFKNLPALMGAYRSFADVITLDDLKRQEIALGRVFPVPKISGGRPQNVVAERSELQEKFFGVPEIVKDEAGQPVFEINLDEPISIAQQSEGKWSLNIGAYGHKLFDTAEEAAAALASGATTPKMTIDRHSIVGQFENLRQLTRETKGKINALSLTGLANKAGLDYRLIDPAAPDFAGSKINLAIERMMRTHERWSADKGTQLVFCDLSVPLSAKAKMASKEKRIYVRDDNGALIHKRGTLHAIKDYEGLPYFLVAEGKGKDKTFTMYDPVTGQVLRAGLDSKTVAHQWVENFLATEGAQERWLDLRERAPVIDADEIAEYKNDRGLDDDGDSIDAEITLEDIEGATGVAAFSVYDDIRAKLLARGVPEHEIAFIHDHDTPQAKEALFKRVNSGDIRFLLGSTPKMGAGTNVQQRLVAEHHIDAPWRPSDLEQREGRIIRRGNLLYERDPEGFEVEINRYATSQTYDTRRWQLLEHKAAGVEQLRNYSGENEIEDVASEAANSADMKAAASGNPLILKETQLRTEVKKLHALAKAHLDGEYSVRNKMHTNRNYAERFGPAVKAELEQQLAQRDGAKDVLMFGGRKVNDKESLIATMTEVGKALQYMEAKCTVVYRGLEFKFDRAMPESPAMTMPSGERYLLKPFSPSGVLIRMENFAVSLEDKIRTVDGHIARSWETAEQMEKLLGKPFAQEAELQAAIAEHGKVQRALMKATSLEAVKPEERAMFDKVLAEQKKRLVAMGYAQAVKELEAGDEIGVGETKLSIGKDKPKTVATAGELNRELASLKGAAPFSAEMQRRFDVEKLLAEALATETNDGIVLSKTGPAGRRIGAYVSQEPDDSGKWRVTWFDERGFSGHGTRESKAKAILEALQEGYRDTNRALLDELSLLESFRAGNAAVAAFHEENDKQLQTKTTPDMDKYIKVAANSIAELRKVDVYRVLVESNRAELREDIATYIKAHRTDLVEEVDSILAVERESKVAPVAPPDGIQVATAGQYCGKVTGIRDGYVIQDTGCGALRAHAIDKLDQVPVVDRMANICYSMGKGKVSEVGRSGGRMER